MQGLLLLQPVLSILLSLVLNVGIRVSIRVPKVPFPGFPCWTPHYGWPGVLFYKWKRESSFKSASSKPYCVLMYFY